MKESASTKHARSIFGDNIKKIRESMGYKQDKFAQLLGIKQSALSQIEGGVRGFTSDSITQIAKILGCQPWELIAPADSKTMPLKDVTPEIADALKQASKEKRKRATDQMAGLKVGEKIRPRESAGADSIETDSDTIFAYVRKLEDQVRELKSSDAGLSEEHRHLISSIRRLDDARLLREIAAVIDRLVGAGGANQGNNSRGS